MVDRDVELLPIPGTSPLRLDSNSGFVSWVALSH